jgi:hypothetical protein
VVNCGPCLAERRPEQQVSEQTQLFSEYQASGVHAYSDIGVRFAAQ